VRPFAGVALPPSNKRRGGGRTKDILRNTRAMAHQKLTVCDTYPYDRDMNNSLNIDPDKIYSLTELWRLRAFHGKRSINTYRDIILRDKVGKDLLQAEIKGEPPFRGYFVKGKKTCCATSEKREYYAIYSRIVKSTPISQGVYLPCQDIDNPPLPHQYRRQQAHYPSGLEDKTHDS
jgi:hypothetical protein